MDPKRSARAVVLFLIGVLLLWGALAWGLPYLDALDDANEPVLQAGDQAVVVRLHHSADAGMHTYRGTIDLPTPCHTLETKLTVAGGASAAIAEIALRVMTDPLAICAQVMTSNEFEVSLSSTGTPSVSVTLDGKPLQVSLTEE